MLHRATDEAPMASPAVGDARTPQRRKVNPSAPCRRIEISMSKAAYEIRAMGNVPVGMLEDFEGVTVSNDSAGSTIHVHLADEAELHGLLDALRRGGFLLIDVRRDPVYGLEERPVRRRDPAEGCLRDRLTTRSGPTVSSTGPATFAHRRTVVRITTRLTHVHRA